MLLWRLQIAPLLLSPLAACFTGAPPASSTAIQFPATVLLQPPAAPLASQSVPAATSTPSGQPQVIALARLLGGNTLVPLAQYVSGRWVATWPLPDEELDHTFRMAEELPQHWFPVPGGLPTEWFLWTGEMRGVPVRSGVPLLAAAHCQGVWGLSTQLPPSGHETTAIATNVRSDFQVFEYSGLDGTADPRLRTFLGTEVETRETESIRASGRDPHTEAVDRRDTDPVYEFNCVDIEESDQALCSFQSSRRYGIWKSDGYPDCDQIVVVQGWYASSPEGFTLLQANTTLTDCDAKELRTVTPLLLMTADARTFVVTREHGYEDESFAVLEIRDSRLHQELDLAGGGC